LTSTVIFFERSPFATAVVTSAMLRHLGWSGCSAMKFTLSVRSFHVPATPGTAPGRPACLRCRPRAPRAYLGRERGQLVHHRVEGVLELEDLAAHVDGDLLRQVAVRDAFETSAMLRTWLVRLLAMKFTLSVRSFHVPATPGTAA
jgi:hypothetical protein